MPRKNNRKTASRPRKRQVVKRVAQPSTPAPKVQVGDTIAGIKMPCDFCKRPVPPKVGTQRPALLLCHECERRII